MHFERYFNNYKDSVVSKIFLKRVKDPCPQTTMEEARELIRSIHALTGGIHQIVYLVGWQAEGHDSKYPSWDEVGQQCCSVWSDDPLESLRMLIREAREKFNTDVSLHINMNDAYPNSPLWDFYVKNDLLAKEENGEICKGGVWDGEQSYVISHMLELRSGQALKRIRGLLTLIPELRESATIHIDSFFGRPSPFHGITLSEDIEAINQIVDLWHGEGMDVSTEFLPSFCHIGYFPHVYHFNFNEIDRLKYPPEVICGGDSLWNSIFGGTDYYTNDGWILRFTAPSGGCRYPQAWGGDDIRYDLTGAQLKDLPQFTADLYTRTMCAKYLYRFRPLRHEVTAGEYIVWYSDQVKSVVNMETGDFSVCENDRCVIDGNKMILELNHATLLYSGKSGTFSFPLPQTLRDCKIIYGRCLPDGPWQQLEISDGFLKAEFVAPGAILLNTFNQIS